MNLSTGEIKVLQEKARVLDVIARADKCHCKSFLYALYEKLICDGCYARRELKRIESEIKVKVL